MRIFKLKKINLKIAILVGLVEITAMSTLFFIVNRHLSRILEVKAINDMDVIAKDRALLIETYISGCCDFIDGYSKIPSVRDVLINKGNPEEKDKLHELTLAYASSHDYIEGLYIAEWDTNILEHTNPDSISMTFREKEKAKSLEESIKGMRRSFCTGIIQSPVTKKMVIPVYSPIYNSKGRAICFAGAAFYTGGLAKKLSQLSDKDISYSLINLMTNEYIFSDNPILVGKECTKESLLSMIQSFKDGKGKDKTLTCKSKNVVSAAYYMPDKNWFFVVEDTNENAFDTLWTVRKILAAVCIFITAIMILVCAISVDHQMKPIKVINGQLENFKAGDYSQSELLDKYTGREDELGAIAHAVKELQAVLENQYQIFYETLEAQTVGTIVTSAEDNTVVMVNKTALKLLGIDPAKRSSVTIDDIKARFSEDERQKIAKARELVELSSEEIVYQTSLKHDDGQDIHLLGHAKTINLSSGDKVIIFSFIDITAQKNLEENLLILSETDSLTAISNRRSGEYKIRSAISDGKHGMFCLFDVNKFKFINDNYGHKAGDKVLVEIANCMKKTFRDSDILIRIGGDEFVVFAPDANDKNIATNILNRLIKNIEKIEIPELDGHKITISLGAVMVEAQESFEQMYTKADSVMYECKARGDNAYKFY